MTDKDVYDNPLELRRMLAAGLTFRSHKQPLPGLFELLRSRVSTLSNWSGRWNGALRVGEVDAELHLLVLPTSSMPLEVMCIFRPCPGKLAVFIGTKRLTWTVIHVLHVRFNQ